MRLPKFLCSLGAALALPMVSSTHPEQQSAAMAMCGYFAPASSLVVSGPARQSQQPAVEQPGQQAFISWDPVQKIEAVTVQPRFAGSALNFGMVIPTPNIPRIDEMPRDFFSDLATFTILLPAPQQIHISTVMGMGNGFTRGVTNASGQASSLTITGPSRQHPVVVLQSGVVGSLDYKTIKADNSQGLFSWLNKNHYSYAGDKDTLDFYIKKNWVFTVMKIDPKQMKKAADGTYTGAITPSRFAFYSNQCVYPIKITQRSVSISTDALFYVQAPQEMDLPPNWSWRPTWNPKVPENEQLQKHLTSLEWAKQLDDTDMSVLENPQANFAQLGPGVNGLPRNAKILDVSELIQRLTGGGQKVTNLDSIRGDYSSSQGVIAQVGGGYTWYPRREAPGSIQGLVRLKGHLQKNQWLTKFRRVISKDEMDNDVVLMEVPKRRETTYIRSGQ